MSIIVGTRIATAKNISIEMRSVSFGGVYGVSLLCWCLWGQFALLVSMGSVCFAGVYQGIEKDTRELRFSLTQSSTMTYRHLVWTSKCWK